MIIRCFKARIRAGQTDNWQRKVERYSIPWLRRQEGMLACYPGKPLSEGSRVYSMISVWQSLEALRQAVGEDWQQVVLLEDEADLVEETSVEHFEFFDTP